MPIEYKTRVAHLIDQVGVEEAEELLGWLQSTPGSSINLKRCTHTHSAVLQALMFEKPRITKAPDSQNLSSWLIASGVMTGEEYE